MQNDYPIIRLNVKNPIVIKLLQNNIKYIQLILNTKEILNIKRKTMVKIIKLIKITMAQQHQQKFLESHHFLTQVQRTTTHQPLHTLHIDRH